MNHIGYLWGFQIKKTAVNNKARAIEQIYVLDPVR